MTESDEQKRRNELRDLISVPGEKVNIDMLMDVLGTVYYSFPTMLQFMGGT